MQDMMKSAQEDLNKKNLYDGLAWFTIQQILFSFFSP